MTKTEAIKSAVMKNAKGSCVPDAPAMFKSKKTKAQEIAAKLSKR